MVYLQSSCGSAGQHPCDNLSHNVTYELYQPDINCAIISKATTVHLDFNDNICWHFSDPESGYYWSLDIDNIKLNSVYTINTTNGKSCSMLSTSCKIQSETGFIATYYFGNVNSIYHSSKLGILTAILVEISPSTPLPTTIAPTNGTNSNNDSDDNSGYKPSTFDFVIIGVGCFIIILISLICYRKYYNTNKNPKSHDEIQFVVLNTNKDNDNDNDLYQPPI